VAKGRPTGGVRVDSSDVDMVFLATGTEKDRPKKSSNNLHPAQQERIKKAAEDIVTGKKRGRK
jgi:hypothetical protein